MLDGIVRSEERIATGSLDECVERILVGAA